jgi:hypothetical protein
MNLSLCPLHLYPCLGEPPPQLWPLSDRLDERQTREGRGIVDSRRGTEAASKVLITKEKRLNNYEPVTL